jgi:hypothetical protein
MTFRGGMGRNGRRLQQRDYELIRSLVLFGGPASERAAEAAGAASERTLQRRVARFEAEGMERAFSAPSTPGARGGCRIP